MLVACLYRISQLSRPNRYPSKRYGWAKDVIHIIFVLLWVASVQSKQSITPT